MDPNIPKIERAERRRRNRMLFRRKKVPVRMLIPNMFTLLSLCAGLTAIRMAIDARFELAVALIVVAGLLDAIDGRVARMLKAQSKFGAELDSLADFANFGVAPIIVIYIWGLATLKGLGWITVLVFAIAMGLRLARFNAMLEVDKPHWQSNYFTGMPAPAGAICVLLPVYLFYGDIIDLRQYPLAIGVYTMLLAGLLVSSIPTFSGKLLGERIEREWVLPLFVGAGLCIALLMQYPHQMLVVGSLAYLGLIPLSRQRFVRHMDRDLAVASSDADEDDEDADYDDDQEDSDDSDDKADTEGDVADARVDSHQKSDVVDLHSNKPRQ